MATAKKRRIRVDHLLLSLRISLVRAASKFAPRTAAKILMPLMFTPVRTQASPPARSVLDRAASEVEVVDGNKIVHYVWGDGQRRVLLLHGWSGNAGQLTALAEALVAAGFTVVTMDQPGHGQSEGKLTSAIHFAKVAEAASRRYGPFYAVVAHSLGAAATTYALSRGLSCEGVVFFNPGASYTSMWKLNAAGFRVPPKVVALAARRAEKWLGVSFEKIESTALAPGFSNKLLVIHDEYDRETPISDSVALVKVWPNAELIKVEKVGHTKILRDDRLVRRAVDFVRAFDESLSE